MRSRTRIGSRGQPWRRLAMARAPLMGCLSACLLAGAGLLHLSCATAPPGSLADGPGTAAAPGVDAAKLTYTYDEDFVDNMGYSGSASAELSRRPRRKLRAEPGYCSKRPLYGYVTLGTGEETRHILVLDESRGTRSGYDVLIIDGNANLDLTDDPTIRGEFDSNGLRSTFGASKLLVAYGDTRLPYHMIGNLYMGGGPSLSLRTVGYCQGEVTINGDVRKVALFDDNGNGRFDDLYTTPRGVRLSSGNIYARGDSMVIDKNGDGKFDKKDTYSAEVHHLGKYLPYDGRCYEVSIAADGRSISLAKMEGDCGRIGLGGDDCSVELLGEDGAIRVRGPGKVKAPVGEYRVVSTCYDATDADGVEWKLMGQGKADQDPVKVAKGNSAKITAGAPIVAKITYSKSGDRQYSLKLEMAGQGGETYTANSILRDGEALPAPRFKVADAKGVEVASGQFEYG